MLSPRTSAAALVSRLSFFFSLSLEEKIQSILFGAAMWRSFSWCVHYDSFSFILFFEKISSGSVKRFFLLLQALARAVATLDLASTQTLVIKREREEGGVGDHFFPSESFRHSEQKKQERGDFF